jgi:soluble lytic murein transglycosylase-like protein
MTRDEMISLAKTMAAAHGLDPTLVCAVCEHESSWIPWASKSEPTFVKDYLLKLKLSPTETFLGGTSLGLMQVLGRVARECGFTGKNLTELCDPATGLEYGCIKLAKCVAAHPGDLRAALLEYNGGGDPSYPDHVLPLMSKYVLQ